MTARIAGYVSRKEWGALPPKATTPLNGRRMKGTGVHHGGSGNLPASHSTCVSRWQGYQRSHLRGDRGPQNDIAYNDGICGHGYVFEGRGMYLQGGANGNRTANREYFSVCIIGHGDLNFTPEARDALEWVILRNRTKGNAGDEVKRHRDFVQNECPGAKFAAFASSLNNKPISGVTEPGSPGTARIGDRGLLVGQAQEYLDALGYDVGKVDGVAGPMFDAAVRAFQTNNGLDVDGVAGPATLTQLRSKDAIMARLHPDDIKAISNDVWRATGVVRAADPNARDGKVSALQELADAKTLGLRNDARLATVEAAVGALSQAQGLDPDKVEEILSGAVDKALADLRIVKGQGPTVSTTGYVSGVSHQEGVRDVEDVDKMTQEA